MTSKYQHHFCLLGSAAVDALTDEEARLISWLHDGFNGRLGFLARDPHKRCDPREVMPSCRSVIVAAMRFADMPLRVGDPSAYGLRMTSCGEESVIPSEAKDLPLYLRHEDYHAVMMRELEAFVSTLREEHPDAEFKCYVDTGPVLEKAWAVRAGLGFIGKNTLFISPEFGSQLALGVVLTSAEIVRQNSVQAVKADCGACTACIDVCPEHALVAPFKLDATKCRSYKFFIEKKVGGCDICQNVCPFNSAG